MSRPAQHQSWCEVAKGESWGKSLTPFYDGKPLSEVLRSPDITAIASSHKAQHLVFAKG